MEFTKRVLELNAFAEMAAGNSEMEEDRELKRRRISETLNELSESQRQTKLRNNVNQFLSDGWKVITQPQLSSVWDVELISRRNSASCVLPRVNLEPCHAIDAIFQNLWPLLTAIVNRNMSAQFSLKKSKSKLSKIVSLTELQHFFGIYTELVTIRCPQTRHLKANYRLLRSAGDCPMGWKRFHAIYS